VTVNRINWTQNRVYFSLFSGCR